MGKTGISRGNFPEQIRDPLIRSGNHSNRFRHRIRRIFPDFFPNPFFSRENDIRSGISVFGVGRYGNFPFPLSSIHVTTNEQKGLMAIEEDNDDVDTNNEDEDEDSDTNDE